MIIKILLKNISNRKRKEVKINKIIMQINSYNSSSNNNRSSSSSRKNKKKALKSV